MGEVQTEVRFRQVEYVDDTGWPKRFYIDSENSHKLLNGEDDITGIDFSPEDKKFRVRGFRAADLTVTAEVEPGSELESFLVVFDQYFK